MKVKISEMNKPFAEYPKGTVFVWEEEMIEKDFLEELGVSEEEFMEECMKEHKKFMEKLEKEDG